MEKKQNIVHMDTDICFDVKLPSNLVLPMRENSILAGCDMCPTFGYRGDLFYMGKSDFTGLMTDPHLCQRCFRRNAGSFFRCFEDITGQGVVFTETVLEDRGADEKTLTENCQKVRSLNLPVPYLPNGKYYHGWYFKLLKDLVRLAKTNWKSKLVETGFLNPEEKE